MNLRTIHTTERGIEQFHGLRLSPAFCIRTGVTVERLSRNGQCKGTQAGGSSTDPAEVDCRAGRRRETEER